MLCLCPCALNLTISALHSTHSSDVVIFIFSIELSLFISTPHTLDLDNPTLILFVGMSFPTSDPLMIRFIFIFLFIFPFFLIKCGKVSFSSYHYSSIFISFYPLSLFLCLFLSFFFLSCFLFLFYTFFLNA